MNKVFVIGIAGGSGSGKSTFAGRIQEYFNENCLTLSCDDYYFSRDDMSLKERDKLNYDAPDALELTLLSEHLRLLKNNISIDCPIYDFSKHTRLKQTKKISPKKIVIVDGILTFYDSKLRELIDLKIFVDSDADERVLRRLCRDVKQRGRTIESVTQQYLSTVKPMHELFVEPTKKYADIVVEDAFNDMAFELIKVKLKSILKEMER